MFSRKLITLMSRSVNAGGASGKLSSSGALFVAV